MESTSFIKFYTKRKKKMSKYLQRDMKTGENSSNNGDVMVYYMLMEMIL